MLGVPELFEVMPGEFHPYEPQPWSERIPWNPISKVNNRTEEIGLLTEWLY